METCEAKIELACYDSDRKLGYSVSSFLAASLVLGMDHTKQYLAN